MKFPLLLLLFLVSIPLKHFSQSLEEKLARAYAGFETDSQLQYGSSSLTVLNAENGTIIFSKNGNTGLSPASTLKTITSATAFYLLGKDYTWQTLLEYTGAITADGTLQGNIILKGSGDPTLGSWRYSQTKPEVVLQRWTDAIRASGIKKIAGSVIADDSLFGTQTLPGGWIWQDIGNYYGAGTSAVSWGENQATLTFQVGEKPGDPTKLIKSEPAINSLKIVNEVTTGNPGSGDNVYAYSAPFSEVIYLRGTYGIDFKKPISISVPDPAFEAANKLSEFLKAAGINVEMQPSTHRRLTLAGQTLPLISKTLDNYTSPALSEVVYWFNKKSINLYGESILRTIALKEKNENTTEEGVKTVKEFWGRKLNLNLNSMNIIDGSGLSPENRITTRSMAAILQSVQKEPWFNNFYESLPVYNDMKMKSGSLRNVLAYTGYHTNSKGVKTVFSFMVNNYNGNASAVRQKMFKVLDGLK